MDAVHSTQWNSGIWWWGHCLWYKSSNQRMQSPKNNVPTTIYHYSTVYCIHCVLWFDPFAPKTVSPPPYTTMPLHTASTVSSGLTFLYQRQCPHHHIPLFHCVPHCMEYDIFFTKSNSPHHPYLLRTLCELTFLHQHLLHTAYLTA